MNRRAARAVSLEDQRRIARRRLPKAVFDFVDGGADDEVTLAANAAAWQARFFRPHALVDVSNRVTTTTVLGQEIALPVILGPTGLTRVISPGRGELAVARAAGRAGTVYVAGTGGSDSLEAISDQASGPLWFQLYLWRDRELSEWLVERARLAGYRALCLTIDVPVRGQRERDLRHGLTYPPRIRLRSAMGFLRAPAWSWALLTHPRIKFANLGDSPVARGDNRMTSAAYMTTLMLEPAGIATWESIAWLREAWDGPLVVKGIMTPEDARAAADAGYDAIVVSNHGGRQLDGLPPTAVVLPEIAAAVGDRVEVLVDGAIRRGTDVVKALALGARACLVARPYLFALAAGGEDGVIRMIEILRTEVDRTLALVGCRSVAELTGSILR